MRQSNIIDAISHTQEVSVNDLAKRFNVTEMTIRRDLATLHDEGKVTRIHGGARLPRPWHYESRANVNTTEKQAIARTIATHIHSGETVGIDLGTTCHAVAERLAHQDDLLVITNAMQAAMAFRYSKSRVILLGGEMTHELNLINSGIFDSLNNILLDTLVLGCGGISATHGLTYFNPAEVEIRQALIKSSKHVIIAADHTKLGSSAGFCLGPIMPGSLLVTDQRIPSKILAELRQDIHVEVATK